MTATDALLLSLVILLALLLLSGLLYLGTWRQTKKEAERRNKDVPKNGSPRGARPIPAPSQLRP